MSVQAKYSDAMIFKAVIRRLVSGQDSGRGPSFYSWQAIATMRLRELYKVVHEADASEMLHLEECLQMPAIKNDRKKRHGLMAWRNITLAEWLEGNECDDSKLTWAIREIKTFLK